MSSPVVVEVNDQLVIEWPDPKPTSFEIASEVFEALIDEVNSLRTRLGAGAWTA